jgi:hypothetical protein
MQEVKQMAGDASVRRRERRKPGLARRAIASTPPRQRYEDREHGEDQGD